MDWRGPRFKDDVPSDREINEWMNVGELKVPENNFLQYIEMPTKLLTKFIFKLKVMFKSLQFMHLNKCNA